MGVLEQKKEGHQESLSASQAQTREEKEKEMAKMELTRKRVLQEIMETERGYVRR